MTFGATEGKPWVEALPTERGKFSGRTFSRFHIIGGDDFVPTVGEIWATSGHAVEAHAHETDELLYVLGGAIEINGRKLMSNEVVFIPRGSDYNARVLSDEGAHILRIELPNRARGRGVAEYQARVWRGPLTDDGRPHLDASPARDRPTQ